MTNGRAVPELATFTFDTGITVHIRKVSPLLIREVSRAFPAPEPPLNRVDYGDGVIKQEPNPADPDHITALGIYQIEIEQRVRRLMIKLGVEVDIDYDVLAVYRAAMAEAGAALDTDDKVAYVTGVCVGTAEDYQDLVKAITRRSQPTEEAVRDAQESFRGQVSGQGA